MKQVKIDEIRPSLGMWKYMRGDITHEQIICYISDLIGGWAISYSARELLKDLGFLTLGDKPNKKAIYFMSTQIHEKYHRNKYSIKIIKPENNTKKD